MMYRHVAGTPYVASLHISTGLSQLLLYTKTLTGRNGGAL